MDPQKITELANLLRNNGDKILNSEFTLTLSGTLLRALNDSFTLITDSAELGAAPSTFQVAKPINSKSPVFRDLQLIYDFVQKTALLCIVHYPTDDYFEGIIDIGKFRALKRLEVQKTNVRQIVGIQRLRAQLQHLICVKSLQNVDEIITLCGGDKSNGFVWNELKIADFSYNNLQRVDTALEFAQFLQHLNLRHNQLRSVEAIKWLPHLKTLDLSFNCLQCTPPFHMEACKRLQSLNMSNNFVEDLMGIAKLDALTDLDLSDNCLLDHSNLLPLSALITLKFLNLYGNPLHYHPKHRLATAQFLHKNTATVKFILDFEPLSKSEKAITGSQQLRHVGSLNRYATKSSSASISSGRITPSTHTPASSVGSLRSFQFHDSSTETEASAPAETAARKRTSKVRTVEIEEAVDTASTSSNAAAEVDTATVNSVAKAQPGLAKVSLTKTLIEEPNTEHLEAKKHIETLREKYGAEWLKSGNAEMMQSVLGIGPAEAQEIDKERNISRQLFNDYLGEFSATAAASTTTIETSSSSNNENEQTFASSTPVNDSTLKEMQNIEHILSPIKSSMQQTTDTNDLNATFYESVDSTKTADISGSTIQTVYKSANGSESSGNLAEIEVLNVKEEEEEVDDEPPHLKNVYSTAPNDEPEISEPEEDEETYIVYTEKRNEAIFLTISSNFLREKDTLTQRTKTKWSLKILESCDRFKSNTLRINFDTVKSDKRERIYTVEDGLCQELENKLRDILSQRDLNEMNQTIYRCVNCTCQFSRENKYKTQHQGVRCPECKSTFVAEIHDIPKSLDKSLNKSKSVDEKLSPAAIVEESPISTPLIVQRSESINSDVDIAEETNSIGSANSLNESSSCSKISQSQSSFDSNQSVAGSSNTERDLEFQTNVESDVDILSNPSQSSIEVLDHYASRKTSEERRISQIPNLETIDDHSYTQSFLEREFGNQAAAITLENVAADLAKQTAALENRAAAGSASGPLAHFNLTESSSSGSVTDSVCTAYEQQAEKAMAEEKIPRPHKKEAQIVIENMLAAESNANTSGGKTDSMKTQGSVATNGASSGGMKKEDSGISSMFGALFQSTNILMSSSKKLIDAEASAPIQTGQVIAPAKALKSASGTRPYKFNYVDFNDIDHRLKLYFYQSKFEEQGEHFKWLARGRIYNEQTQSLHEGIVVMSTCKFYLMEAYASEHDDITKWLRQVVSVTMDRLEYIQMLPWKVGLSFCLRGWGGFLLLLQDILRTDSLMLYFANNALPMQCELKHQTADEISERLNAAVHDEQLKMCSLINACEVKCGEAKRQFSICALLTTDTRLCLTSSKIDWLTVQPLHANDVDIELCVTQYMSNLVEIERPEEHVFTINFLDETQNKCELWRCTFETKENADSCLNAIGQSWEQLFGVPLSTACM